MVNGKACADPGETDGPWSSFEIQVGTAAQNMRVMISTASTFTWTVGSGGCPPNYVNDCANSRGFLFLPNQSLTWVPNSIYGLGFEDNIGFDSSGAAGFDTLTLGYQGQGGPSQQHSVVFNLFDSKYWLGEFGLNPRSTNFSTFADPQTSFLQSVRNNGSIPSLTYGYTAGNQYRFDKVFGSLVLGGYDQNRFTPTNVSFPFYTDISRDLLVNIQGITSDSPSTGTNLLPDGSISAFIDSTIPYIYLPISACKAFEKAFGITYSTDYDLYLINNTQHQALRNTDANVTFTLSPQKTGGDTVDIVMPYGAFDLQINFPVIENPNTSYYFPLMRAQNDTQYTLGRAFLQEAYLIVDHDRQNFTVAPCTWDQKTIGSVALKSILTPDEAAAINSNSNTTNKQNNGSGSGLSVGAIVGVAVGIVAVIALLGLALWLVRKRKQAEKRRLAEIEAEKAVGLGKESDEHNPFISGELGGGEIHELTAAHKQSAQELDSPYKMDPNKHGYSEAPGDGYYAPDQRAAHEMQGSHRPVYEMAGSEVQEMPAADHRVRLRR